MSNKEAEGGGAIPSPFPNEQGYPSTALFPIAGGQVRIDGKMAYLPRTFIPWWLAEEAYVTYCKFFGSGQSLPKLAARGGFSRQELLILLRWESPLEDGPWERLKEDGGR